MPFHPLLFHCLFSLRSWPTVSLNRTWQHCRKAVKVAIRNTENTQIIYCHPRSNLCLLLKKKNMLESISSQDSSRPSCLNIKKENQESAAKEGRSERSLWRSLCWAIRKQGVLRVTGALLPITENFLSISTILTLHSACNAQLFRKNSSRVKYNSIMSKETLNCHSFLTLTLWKN